MLLTSLPPDFQRALRLTIMNQAVVSSAAQLMIERYGSEVQWAVTAWGTARVVLEPRLEGSRREIIKIGMIVPDAPIHPLILRPYQTIESGTDLGGRIVGAECYPCADILGETDLGPYPVVRALLQEMREEFERQGFDVYDVHPSNVGLLPDGTLTLVDNEVWNMAETRFPRHKKPEDEALWLENLQRQVEHRHAAYEGIGSAAEADHLVEYERLMGDHDVLAMVTQEAIAEDFRRTHDSVRREVADWASGHAAVLDVLERTRPESALPENLYVNAEQLIRRGRELIGKYRHSAAIADSVGKTQATAVSGFEKWIKTGALEADQNAVHGLAALAQ